MTGRHVLLMLAVAAVGLCVLLLLRVLDPGEAVEETLAVEPAPGGTARAPAPVTMRTEPGPEPAPSPLEAAPPTADTPALTADGPGGLDEAEQALRELTLLLRNARATNDEILGALARVLALYLRPPLPPGVEATGAGGALPTVPDANLRLLAERQGWPAGYLEQVLVWRRRAEKEFLQALKLQKVESEREVNAREAVNIAAAKALATTANAKLTRKMIRVVETTIFKARVEVSQVVYDETLGALADLGNPDALEWMGEEFTHAKQGPKREVDLLSAAHRAMVRFDRDELDGKVRYEIVREMIKTYAGVESGAADGDDGYPAFWSRIGKDAIQVVRYFAYDPVGDDREPLATMAELTEWFRTHKDSRKPPWQND